MTEAPRDQVAALLQLLSATLGSSLLGVYLFGSAIADGLRPESDLDLFGVIDRGLHRDERRAVVDGLLPLSGRETRPSLWRPVDLTLVVRTEVVPWRYPPRFDLQYGEWLRSAFLAGDLEPWPPVNPDVAVLITMVRGRSETLEGPPPHELLAAVPATDLRRAMSDEVGPLLDDLEADTRNVLLTLARMWMTSATGSVGSKDAAAVWAAERMPAEHGSIVLRARSGYLGEAEDRWDDLAAARSAARGLVRKLAVDQS